VFERFTDRARRVVVLAQDEARMLNHNYIGTEHILLGLIHEGEGIACQALESLGISLSAVRAQVEEIIGHGQAAPTGHVPFTPRAKKVLELSLREALQLGHGYIGTEHILLGLVREGEGVAAQVLQKLGADLDRVRTRVTQLLQGYAEGEVAPGEALQTDPKELVRKAAERARRARELSERLATSLDDPSVTADDVFYGFLVMEERLLGLEVVARRLEEGNRPAEGEGEGEGKTGEES
jgi:ATP-dependent Clp protease ATP-binding subunit ClpA